MAIRLLVSVRNAEEAVAATDAGADIIDIKEPDSGPLGFAGTATITGVVQAVDNRRPVSAALGECCDWLTHDGGESINPPDLPAGLSYVKLGLSAISRIPVAVSAGASADPQDWQKAWNDVRNAVNGAAGPERLNWVAAAYADFPAADAPHPQEILNAAVKAGCGVFLIDTFHKNGQTTFDCLSDQELGRLRTQARASGLAFALAGQLTEQHIDHIHRLDPDILGVRGAVCDGSNRTNQLSSERVSALKAKL